MNAVTRATRKVLVVDDEVEVLDLVATYLRREGLEVVSATDGERALELAQQEKPDLVVLDLMLPGVDGWEVCRRLRQRSTVPIIMLTARDDESDKLVGLELGADDYVTKPFSPKELVARVRAQLRRAGWVLTANSNSTLVVGDLEIDPERHEVTLGGRSVPLTPTEFKLLHTMAKSPGRVYTRLQLVDQVQGYAFEGYERTIDAHIKNLRQKLGDDPREPRYIETVYGVGYRLAVREEESR